MTSPAGAVPEHDWYLSTPWHVSILRRPCCSKGTVPLLTLPLPSRAPQSGLPQNYQHMR